MIEASVKQARVTSKTIRIDDEVFKALQDRAEPLVDTPNSVLRKLLGLTNAGTDDDDAGKGSLWILIEAGLLKPGDVLIWKRPRRGDEFKATVTADGSLMVNGSMFFSPSAAAAEVGQGPVNGWQVWQLNKVSLAELRTRAMQRHE